MSADRDQSPFTNAPTPQRAAAGKARSRPRRLTPIHAQPNRPTDTPPNMRVEFVVIDGEEGRKLRARQAHAIREVLRWLHENHDAGG